MVVQTPFEVKNVFPLPFHHVREQLETLLSSYKIEIVNVGIWGDTRTLGWIKEKLPHCKILFDPIWSSGSGKFPFASPADLPLIKDFIASTYLITPNIPEAEILAGIKINSLTDMAKAAQKIKMDYRSKNILLKGGHLGQNINWDILFCDGKYYRFGTRPKAHRIHGTGSYLNSLIATNLAKQIPLVESVARAKNNLKRAVNKSTPQYPILL